MMGLVTGAEIGIYNRDLNSDSKQYGFSEENSFKTHYNSAAQNEWMNIGFQVYKDGNAVLDRSSDGYYSGNDAKDWWLTQFKLGEHSDKENLSMKAEIDFGNQKDILKDKFLEQTKKLQEEGVPIITTHFGSKVTISWEPNK